MYRVKAGHRGQALPQFNVIALKINPHLSLLFWLVKWADWAFILRKPQLYELRLFLRTWGDPTLV
jgi:hypothetical protein